MQAPLFGSLSAPLAALALVPAGALPAGRLLRDAELYEVGAGTSEIRRWLIGRELFAKTG